MGDERTVRVSMAPREHARLVRGEGDQLVVVVDRLDPVFDDRGMYGKDKTGMPKRFRFLHPDAARSLLQMEKDYPGVFFYSDVLRNANGSRHRRRKNRDKRIRQGKTPIYTGKKPGFSAHSFGLCTDDMVRDNMRRLAAHLEEPEISKADYDAVKKQYGWWCHRDGPNGGDHSRGHEEWHYNWFGDDPERWLDHSGRKTSGGVEAKVQALYGPFILDPAGVKEHLDRLGYATDKAGIEAFQGDWTLSADGKAGPITQRTLLYVGAEFRTDGGELLDLQ
jgi:hypothetical protein